MKIKTTLLSIIVAANTLYSQDNNTTAYKPNIGYNFDRDNHITTRAPALPSNPEDLKQIDQLRKLVNVQNEQIESLNKHVDEQQATLDEVSEALYARINEVTEYRIQLHIPLVNGWFYHPTQGWIYTDRDTFPYVYRDANKSWYFFERDLRGGMVEESGQGVYGRAFFNYTTNEWEIWE